MARGAATTPNQDPTVSRTVREKEPSATAELGVNSPLKVKMKVLNAVTSKSPTCQGVERYVQRVSRSRLKS